MAVIFELRQIYSEFSLSELRFPLFFFFGVICCANSSTYHYERSNDRRIQEFVGEGFILCKSIDEVEITFFLFSLAFVLQFSC